MKMPGSVSIYLIGIFLIPVLSCGNLKKERTTLKDDNKILQQNDGSFSLKLAKADCYSDIADPSNNTAEWNIVISNPGKFNVWLSSATKDTSALKYANSVKINLMDKCLEVDPACDKIVPNSLDVHYPYFRADSFMGSVFVSEPGEYNIQLISEKVIASASKSESLPVDDTKLMSVMLTPSTR
jgi:hypothetical protein